MSNLRSHFSNDERLHLCERGLQDLVDDDMIHVLLTGGIAAGGADLLRLISVIRQDSVRVRNNKLMLDKKTLAVITRFTCRIR